MRSILGLLFASLLFSQSSYAQRAPKSKPKARTQTVHSEPKKEITKEEAKEETISRDEFVDVEKEPQAIEPIRNFVVYPDVAKRSGIEGKVVLTMLIGTNGKVEKVEVDHADYDLFIDAAKEAAMKATFTPALQQGKPVRVWMTQTVSFRLR